MRSTTFKRFAAAAMLATAMVPMSLAGTAMAAKGGNSANAKACQKEGWQSWVRADQTPFANQDECVSYGAQGGTLTVPLPVPPAVLVRAYTDVVVDGVFGAGDREIARLEDTNDDGVVSVGDHVITTSYPTDFGATSFGTFGFTNHVVSSVDLVNSQNVQVQTVEGALIHFLHSTANEAYRELIPPGLGVLQILDSLDPAGFDSLAVLTQAPSQPSVAVNDNRSNGTDDAFIEVDISL